MNYFLDNYNTFIIASANIKYLGINLIKDIKDFYTYSKKKITYKILLKNI